MEAYKYRFRLSFGSGDYFFPLIHFQQLELSDAVQIQIPHPLDGRPLADFSSSRQGIAYFKDLYENFLVAIYLYQSALTNNNLNKLSPFGPEFKSGEYFKAINLAKEQFPKDVQILSAIWTCCQESKFEPSEYIPINEIAQMTNLYPSEIKDFLLAGHRDLFAPENFDFLMPMRQQIEYTYNKEEPSRSYIVTLIFENYIFTGQSFRGSPQKYGQYPFQEDKLQSQTKVETSIETSKPQQPEATLGPEPIEKDGPKESGDRTNLDPQSIDSTSSSVEDFPVKLPETSVIIDGGRPGGVARYDSDFVKGPDYFELENDIKALCSVMIAKDVKPPLSVGLFGDWGSGKSFFMSQMREWIDRNSPIPANNTMLCRRVKQIEFNAWNYVDADLWASLVTHIFDELAKPLQGDGQDAPWQSEKFLQLESSKKLLEDSLNRKKVAEELLLEAEKKEQNKILEEKEKSKVIGENIKASFQIILRSPSVQTSINAMEKNSNIQLILKDAKDSEDLLKNSKALITQLRTSWDVIKVESKTGWGRVRIASVLVVPLLSFLFVQDLHLNGQRWIGWAASCVPVFTYFSSVISNAGKALERLRSYADVLQKEVASAGEVLKVQQGSLTLKQAVNDAHATVEKCEQQVKEANDALLNAKLDIASGRQMRKFVEERGGSKDYRSKLGVVDLIRRDFEKLEILLKEIDTEAKESRGIERIVLYIDDLDRCPPDRVVDVLQAIHLLLALPLFVVVVGVDARWLLKSLRLHYSIFLGQDRDKEHLNGEDSGHWASTPQNYLEKIFQIPYSLKRMPEEGYRNLIRAMVKARPSEPMGASPAGPVQSGVGDIPGSSSVARQENPGSNVAGTASSAPSVDTTSSSTASPPPKLDSPKPESFEKTGQLGADLRFLELYEDEQKFLELLQPIIPSPRSAKRLVNLYRLIRATTESHVETVREGKLRGTNYAVVMLLLAMQIGFPDQTYVIFENLLNDDSKLDFHEYMLALEPHGAVGSTNFRNALKFEMDKSESIQWLHLVRGYVKIKESRNELPNELTNYRIWIPSVARYSFKAARLLE
jgi:hypothetical protein